jgi:hypothetical protein
LWYFITHLIYSTLVGLAVYLSFTGLKHCVPFNESIQYVHCWTYCSFCCLKYFPAHSKIWELGQGVAASWQWCGSLHKLALQVMKWLIWRQENTFKASWSVNFYLMRGELRFEIVEYGMCVCLKDHETIDHVVWKFSRLTSQWIKLNRQLASRLQWCYPFTC